MIFPTHSTLMRTNAKIIDLLDAMCKAIPLPVCNHECYVTHSSFCVALFAIAGASSIAYYLSFWSIYRAHNTLYIFSVAYTPYLKTCTQPQYTYLPKDTNGTYV